MRFFRNLMIAALSFLATSAIVIAAHAQSTASVILSLDKNSFVQSHDGSDQAHIDLMKAMKKVDSAALTSGQFEIQMLRVRAKTGMSGARFSLNINKSLVDSGSLETNPEQFSGDDMSASETIELKNSVRAQTSEASLTIQGFSNTKIASIEVVIDTEDALLSHYSKNKQAELLGANDGIIKPDSSLALPGLQSMYDTTAESKSKKPAQKKPVQKQKADQAKADQVAQTLNKAIEQSGSCPGDKPAAVKPVAAKPAQKKPVKKSEAQQKAPAAKPAQVIVVKPAPDQLQPQAPVAAAPAIHRCAVNHRGETICIGATVHNRFGFAGVVEDLQTEDGESQALVKFGFSDSNWRDVDSVSN